ncbi:MAG: hypothetical protein ACOCX3_00380 [Chloroflexota bacterium]
MMQFSREDMKARSELFDRFALKDQKSYYRRAIENNRKASSQINRIRALLSFLTGLAAALAGLIVQSSFLGSAACGPDAVTRGASCDTLEFVVSTLSILAVVLPALGGAFSTLADLYQWDKLTGIYNTALLNMEEADALSPRDQMDDLTLRASMRAFAEGTLSVMNDETTQWGQSVRAPRQLEKFIEDERIRVARTIQRAQGGAFKDRLDDEDKDNTTQS